MLKPIFLFLSLALVSQVFSNDPEQKSRGRIWGLEERVRVLENELDQLREEMQQLRHAIKNQPSSVKVIVPANEAPAKTWVCAITSNFNRTYTGNGRTKIEAGAGALKACQENEGGISCNERKLQCDCAE